jgi:hypothetical protein
MAEKIRSLGVDCWLDEKDLEGGDIIPDELFVELTLARKP